jgi:hypothetical protein
MNVERQLLDVDWVYDPVLDQVQRGIDYARHYEAVEKCRYSSSEVLQIIQIHGHCGPW